jgi:hypothetical protein
MLTVSQGDYGYAITDTLQDSNGTAFDLSNYAVKLHVWRPGKASVLIVNSNATVISNAAGTVSYTVANTDFTYAGMYNAEWEATKTGIKQSFPTVPFQINVEESA